MSSERTTENAALTIKVQNYTAAGVVVWVVRPEQRQVEIFERGKKTVILREGDTLTGDGLLPDFALDVGRLFRRLPG